MFDNDFQQDPSMPIYAWLAITGAILFGFFLLWRFDFLLLILESDQTRLSLMIIGLFGLTCLYLGLSSWQLAKHKKALLHWAVHQDNNVNSGQGTADASHWIQEHLALTRQSEEKEGLHAEALHARLVEKVHRGHNLGWFAVDFLIRLGLIGTVIGFILMLSTVYKLQNEEVSALQELLSSMGAGMQVALYTTLTGISASMLLSVYCKVLDRFADNLVGDIVRQSVLGHEKQDRG
ncbi:MAG: MotA/TolQ/ExbB proton channel family protein [Arenicellales bacterium]